MLTFLSRNCQRSSVLHHSVMIGCYYRNNKMMMIRFWSSNMFNFYINKNHILHQFHIPYKDQKVYVELKLPLIYMV